jgi:hypothetical protein
MRSSKVSANAEVLRIHKTRNKAITVGIFCPPSRGVGLHGDDGPVEEKRILDPDTRWMSAHHEYMKGPFEEGLLLHERSMGKVRSVARAMILEGRGWRKALRQVMKKSADRPGKHRGGVPESKKLTQGVAGYN